MLRRRSSFVVALFLGAVLAPGVAAATDSTLVWDATEKTHQPAAGETVASFEFVAHNDSDRAITVTAVETACRCTTAQFPTCPYTIRPHGSAVLHATVYFAGKQGEFSNGIWVETSVGQSRLRVKVVTAVPANRTTKRGS